MAAKKSKHGYDGKIAGLYDLEDTIGRGHFAVVKLARHVFTGEKVAVKVIDKTKLDEVSKSHLFQEVRCMKLVQHPNVVRLYEVIDTQTKLYLILELGDGGDMYDYIMKHTGGLEEKVAKRYFRQIVEAISYCHKLHVVHRDLKPENVVFFEKVGLVKLTDFGFSNMFAPGKKLETSCGSLAYSAPEILLGDSYDAPAVDVWSLGVILYMLVVGEAPFQEANDSETLTMIMDCRYHVPPHISPQCKDLIGKMLQREPSKRATLSSILAHPWLNDGDLTPVAPFLPLITKEMITDDDQSYVVQKMVEGKIAAREEILLSIEKNSYNHITATYYLLIERRLRKHQQHEHYLLQQQPSSGSLRKQSAPSPARAAKPHLEPLMLSPRQGTTGSENSEPAAGTSHYVQSLVSPPGTHPSTSTGSSRQQLQTTPSPTDSNRLTLPGVAGVVNRKCSLITEESVDEYDDDDDDDVCDMDGATIKPVKSMESLDEIGSGSHITIVTPAIVSPGLTTSQPPANTNVSSSAEPVNPRRPLKSVCSSPQLLNQIHEENESEDEDDFVPLKLTTPRRFGGSGSGPHSSSTSAGSHREASSASPEILRKYEQRKKRRGAGQRGTSCSSSDASDTDDTEGRSRKDKLRHKFIHRRDSSDHSSDTDGPGGGGGGGGGTLGGNSRLGSSSGGGGGGGSGGGSNGGGGSGGGSRGGGGGGSRTHNGSGGGRGGGSGRSSGGHHERKENADNRNHNNNSDVNNKNSINNHRNSKFHGGGGGGGSKGSLTDSSLKLFTRKLSDISNGVGALLSDCRGSDCDNYSSSSPSTIHQQHKTSSTTSTTTPTISPLLLKSSLSYPLSSSSQHKLNSPGSFGSGSGSPSKPSRNTSFKSNSSAHSSRLHSDTSGLFALSEKGYASALVSPKTPPVQYLGQSTDAESISCEGGGRRQSSLEFSDISSCLADGESLCAVSELPSVTHNHRRLGGVAPCRNCDVVLPALPPASVLQCKPAPRSASVMSVKSKCCSVV